MLSSGRVWDIIWQKPHRNYSVGGRKGILVLVLHLCLILPPCIPIKILLYIAAPIPRCAVKKSLDHSFPVQYPPRSLALSLARGWIAFGSLSWVPQHIQTFFLPVPSFLLPLFSLFDFSSSFLAEEEDTAKEGEFERGWEKQRERESRSAGMGWDRADKSDVDLMNDDETAPARAARSLALRTFMRLSGARAGSPTEHSFRIRTGKGEKLSNSQAACFLAAA